MLITFRLMVKLIGESTLLDHKPNKRHVKIFYAYSWQKRWVNNLVSLNIKIMQIKFIKNDNTYVI